MIEQSIDIGDASEPELFIAGGALPPDYPYYIERAADDILYDSVLAGRYCHIFAARYLGKSSLMAHAVGRLKKQGFRTAAVDLSSLDPDLKLDQLFLLLVKQLVFQLGLAVDPQRWWAEHGSGKGTAPLITFLKTIVLEKAAEPIVIFLDDLDSTIPAKVRSHLFKAVYAAYQAREADSAFQRLTFVLLGSTPVDAFGQSEARRLFEVSREIDLQPFSHAEAVKLRQLLQEACNPDALFIFDRIYYWTDGHPYLIQRICAAVVRRWDKHWVNERVDTLIDTLFAFRGGYHDPKLQAIEEWVQAYPQRRKLLTLYQRIRQSKRVPLNSRSDEQNCLRELGLVQVEGDALAPGNEVFRQVFGPAWIRTHIPINKTSLVIISLVLLLIVGAVGGFFWQQQQRNQTQAQDLVVAFKQAETDQERLIYLAGLLELRGHEEEARQLFFEDISPEQQENLFYPDDPRAVGEALVTVIRELYTSPELETTAQADKLLEAMTSNLPALEQFSTLRTVELDLEIRQWLKGRELYRDGEYDQALRAYNVALNLNERNVGVYFDRALAYRALADLNRTVDDFNIVLNVDERWSTRVQSVVLNDPPLYAAITGTDLGGRKLVAIVPSPTMTPSPTNTATSTSTPSPTNTPLPTATPTETPLPPTATPTATATPRPTQVVVSESTATPTFGVPQGEIVLLEPAGLEPASNGPTDFRWEWHGPALPPDYGFEVRVWREGEFMAGAHDAILDNKSGRINYLGDDVYQLETDITQAQGVREVGGVYEWTVAVVQIAPDYKDLGIQAQPGQMKYEAPISGGNGGDNGGGTTIGIE